MGYHKERIRQFVGLPGTAMQVQKKANRHFVDCRGPLKCRTGKKETRTKPHLTSSSKLRLQLQHVATLPPPLFPHPLLLVNLLLNNGLIHLFLFSLSHLMFQRPKHPQPPPQQNPTNNKPPTPTNHNQRNRPHPPTPPPSTPPTSPQ